MQCTNPIPKYLDPLLCGGHCDNINPPEFTVNESANVSLGRSPQHDVGTSQLQDTGNTLEEQNSEETLESTVNSLNE